MQHQPAKTGVSALMPQIYTDGPATSRATVSESRPQNEQRNFDRSRRRAAPASFANRLMALYPRFARAKQPAIGLELMVLHRCGERRRGPWRVLDLERDDFIFEWSSRSSLLFEHDLFRKPVPTPHQARGRLFRDHALERIPIGLKSGCALDSLSWRMSYSENRYPLFRDMR
jgi:hypothetical protein